MSVPSTRPLARRSLPEQLRIVIRLTLGLVLVLIAGLLRPFLPLFALLGIPRWWPAAVWFRVFLPVIGVRVVTHGKLAKRPALLAANHVSWIDIAALGTYLGGGFVSKSEVAQWPLVGWFATGTGTVYLSRGAHKTQQTSDSLQQRFRDGFSIAIFPEGTTTKHRLPRLFHSRLFGAAIDHAVLVQPVAIHYPPPASSAQHEQHPIAPFIEDIGLMEHLLNVLACPGLTVEITFGTPIATDGLDRRTLAERTRESICAMLGSPGHVGERAIPPGRKARSEAQAG